MLIYLTKATKARESRAYRSLTLLVYTSFFLLSLRFNSRCLMVKVLALVTTNRHVGSVYFTIFVSRKQTLWKRLLLFDEMIYSSLLLTVSLCLGTCFPLWEVSPSVGKLSLQRFDCRRRVLVGFFLNFLFFGGVSKLNFCCSPYQKYFLHFLQVLLSSFVFCLT